MVDIIRHNPDTGMFQFGDDVMLERFTAPEHDAQGNVVLNAQGRPQFKWHVFNRISTGLVPADANDAGDDHHCPGVRIYPPGRAKSLGAHPHLKEVDGTGQAIFRDSKGAIVASNHPEASQVGAQTSMSHVWVPTDSNGLWFEDALNKLAQMIGGLDLDALRKELTGTAMPAAVATSSGAPGMSIH